MSSVTQQVLFSYGVFQVEYHIPADTIDFNLRTFFISRGWNTTSPIVANVYVDVTNYVGGSLNFNETTHVAAATYAIDTGSIAWPTGSRVTIVNNGSILGCGGRGADGNASPYPATEGGTALRAQVPIFVVNNGTIAGGGGGGGGGQMHGTGPACGAGGGRGYIGGNGGTGQYWGAGTADSGTAGTKTAVGLGGVYAPAYDGYQYAGNGGGLGQDGLAGGLGMTANPGALRGYYVQGNANVTWSGAGSLLGRSS